MHSNIIGLAKTFVQIFYKLAWKNLNEIFGQPNSWEWRRKWQPTPVFLPGESHGQRSLAGYSPWSLKIWIRLRESTTTIAVRTHNIIHIKVVWKRKKQTIIIKIRIDKCFDKFTLLLQNYLSHLTLMLPSDSETREDLPFPPSVIWCSYPQVMPNKLSSLVLQVTYLCVCVCAQSCPTLCDLLPT